MNSLRRSLEVTIAVLLSAVPGLLMAAETSQLSRRSMLTPSTSSSSLVVVQEDVLIPLIDEPEQNFHRAERLFKRGDRKGAAAEIRAGAALIELEGGRHNASNKTGLDRAAARLNQLAKQVEDNKVESEKPLRAAFAEADLELARHYHAMAEETLSHNDRSTGQWLRGAADSVADAAEWSERKLASGTKAGLSSARRIGTEIEAGAKWTSDEVRTEADAVGHAIESLASENGSPEASTNAR
jgi:hypothetical protein